MVAHLLNLHATINITYDLQASDNNYAQFISLEPSLFNKNTELNIAHFCFYYVTILLQLIKVHFQLTVDL